MRSSQLNLRQVLAGVAAIAILSSVVLLTVGGNAAQPLMDWRAGTAGFETGKDGINITFSSPPMPDTKYAIHVQATNTAGYSPTSVCTYFNPLHKRVDGFEVQHKRCDDGVPVALDVNVSLDWIAVEYR